LSFEDDIKLTKTTAHLDESFEGLIEEVSNVVEHANGAIG